MVGSTFVGDTELDSMINTNIRKLYDKLVTAYGEEYFSRSTDFSTVSGTDSYSLAAKGISNFLKLRGVDLVLASDYIRPIERFGFKNRNRWLGSSYWDRNNWRSILYRLMGGNLIFRPIPLGVYTVRVWDIPAFTSLSAVTDTFDGINGWEDLVILRTAKTMLDKEESDVSTLMDEIQMEEQRLDSVIANRDMNEEPPVDVYADSYDDEFQDRY